MAKKTYRINGGEVSVKAANTVYNGRISSEDNAQDAIDNLDARVSTLEQGGGGGGSGSSSNPYAGKIFAFIGDSYTHLGTWASRLCSNLGASNGRNLAIDGGTWRRRRYNETDSQGNPNTNYSGLISAFAQAVALKNYYSSRQDSPDYIIIFMGCNDANSIAGAGFKIGSLDYGKVYYNTYPVDADLDNMTAEEKAAAHDGYGYLRYINGAMSNKIDPSNPFWKYARTTTWSNTNLNNKGCRREAAVDPINYVKHGADDAAGIDATHIYGKSNVPTSNPSAGNEDAESLDQRTIIGGMQATVDYLKFHFPNAIIKIGYTPMGMMITIPNSGFTYAEQVCTALKEVATIYAVDYVETRFCGWSPLDSQKISNNAGDGHPSTIGGQAIGDYLADIFLGKRGNET